MRIEDYLDKKGVERDTLHRRSLMYYCPLVQEKTASFHVSADEQLWHCHSCKQGGKLVYLVFLLEQFDHFWQAYKYLGLAKEQRKEESTPVPTQKRVKVSTYAPTTTQILFACASRWWHKQLWSETTQAGTARHYLLERGISLRVLHTHPIGYAPKGSSQAFSQMLAYDSGLSDWRELAIACGLIMLNGEIRMQGRVMFSCQDTQGHALYFQGRILPPYRSKYKYLGATGCSKYPFSLSVEHPVLEGTIGVEAPIGAAVLASYCVGNLATLGNGTVTREILHSYPAPWYWAQDNDELRPIRRNGIIVGYEQPGEIQAQACIERCKSEGLPTFRLQPPAITNGLDEWLCAEQSVTPLLHAIQQRERLALNA